MLHSYYPASFLSIGILTASASALAGIPECRDLRLEDVASGGCELRGGASCEASCSRLGIYEKACATRLHKVCRNECTITGDAGCSAECNATCTSECDRGVNITCIHNCFGECAGSCDAQCEAAADPAQCRATCEATCDGECDVQCRPIVDGDCYTHCIECCDGSCTAQANMDCQEVCQNEEFEDCEHELEVECSGSCDVDVSLFCEGEYMLSGDDLPACVEALIAKGTLEAEAEGSVSFDGGSLDTSSSAGGCEVERASGASGSIAPAALGLAIALLRRRRSVRQRR